MSKITWKWTMVLSAFFVLIVGVFLLWSIAASVKSERNHGIGFSRAAWNIKDDQGYVNRNKMIGDLLAGDRLKNLSAEEIAALLGQPDRSDNGYLFYRISQQRIGFFPLHTTTLVLRLDNGVVKSVMIHE